MLSNIFAELSNKTSADTAPSYLNFKGQAITGDKKIAEAFNNHISQIARTYLTSNTSTPTSKQSQVTLKKFVQSKMPP